MYHQYQPQPFVLYTICAQLQVCMAVAWPISPCHVHHHAALSRPVLSLPLFRCSPAHLVPCVPAICKVVELRGLLTMYLEQLQSYDGPDVEQLMVKALEAADSLDAVITLQKVGRTDCFGLFSVLVKYEKIMYEASSSGGYVVSQCYITAWRTLSVSVIVPQLRCSRM